MKSISWKILCVGVLAFAWMFCTNIQGSAANKKPLVTIVPTQQPRPAFVGDVSPPEGSIIPLNVYQVNVYEDLIHEGVRSEKSGFAKSICLATIPVLEPGDKLDVQDVLSRVSADVDGRPLTNMVYTIALDLLAIAQDAEGPFWVVSCWEADLKVGSHDVTVRFSLTSGKVLEYTWRFEITDDVVFLPTFTPQPQDASGSASTTDATPLATFTPQPRDTSDPASTKDEVPLATFTPQPRDTSDHASTKVPSSVTNGQSTTVTVLAIAVFVLSVGIIICYVRCARTNAPAGE
jgi:hypothetical protein